jgi:hypothetical protein
MRRNPRRQQFFPFAIRFSSLRKGLENLIDSIENNYASEDTDEDDDPDVDGVIDADMILEDLREILRAGEVK